MQLRNDALISSEVMTPLCVDADSFTCDDVIAVVVGMACGVAGDVADRVDKVTATVEGSDSGGAVWN